MQALTDFFHRLSDLPELVRWAGLIGLTAIVFSETGLLIGVFLPGDSLLVTAGLLSARDTEFYTLSAPWPSAIFFNSLEYSSAAHRPPHLHRENTSSSPKAAIRAHEFYSSETRRNDRLPKSRRDLTFSR